MIGAFFQPAVGPTLMKWALIGTLATNPIEGYVEMEFWGQGQGWTDVTPDVTDAAWRTDRGLPGITALDRTAKTGTWKLELRNDPGNSTGKLGAYSPDNVNCRAGFKEGIGVRLILNVVQGNITSRIPRFVGELDSINITAGLYDARTVPITVVDWMNHAETTPMGGLPVQVAQRSDQVWSAVVGIVPRQPRALSVQFGLDSYPYALDATYDGSTMVATELQRIDMSELGLTFVKGDGTLVFENRRTRPTTVTAVDTFLDTELSGLTPIRDRKTIISRVLSTVYPRSLQGSATAVLWSLASVTSIGPGETQVIGPASYRDPTNLQASIGAIGQIPPAASTDYAFNGAADGSGLNLTAQCVVTAAFSGNSVIFTLKNNSTQTAFYGGNTSATKLQCRGQALTAYGSIVLDQQDTTVRDTVGQNVLQIDMTYQADPAVGLEVSQYLLAQLKKALTQLPKAQVFIPNNDTTMLLRVLSREISDRIAIQETVSGLGTSSSYFINGEQLDIDERMNITVTWPLVPADTTRYWLVEVVGASELDQTTIPGYGLIVGHIDVAHADAHLDSSHSDITHGDTNHGDAAHADQHNDSAHGDTAHSDSAHVDAPHSDIHGDGDHSDVAHVDTPHGDSHSDSAHNDSHSDTTHVDAHNDSHSDSSHGDDAHTDSTIHTDHIDSHFDVPQIQDHGDQTSHFDNAHFDVPHGDTAHADDHSDISHVDTHVDTAHSDSHSDASHSDAAHNDASHNDSHFDGAHVDTAHIDVSHLDGSHSDSHDDTVHADTVHSDSPHTDTGHADSHGDTAHGDA